MLVKDSNGNFNKVYAVKGMPASALETRVDRCISSDGSNHPFGGLWTSNLIPPEPGKFIWSRIEQYLSDGSKMVMYNVAKCGDGDIKPYTVNKKHPDGNGGVSITDLYAFNGNWKNYSYSYRGYGSRDATIELLSHEKFLLLSLIVSAPYADITITKVGNSMEERDEILFTKNVRTAPASGNAKPIDRTTSITLPISFNEPYDILHEIRISVYGNPEAPAFMSWSADGIIASK